MSLFICRIFSNAKTLGAPFKLFIYKSHSNNFPKPEICFFHLKTLSNICSLFKYFKMNKLFDIEKVIDWNQIETITKNDFVNLIGIRNDVKVTHRSLLKLLYIQHLYDLGKLELEDKIIDKPSFRKFAGVKLKSGFYYSGLLWRFKADLLQAGTLAEAMEAIDEQVRTGLREKKPAADIFHRTNLRKRYFDSRIASAAR